MRNEAVVDAMRFWERGRIAYNLTLAVVAFAAAGFGAIGRMGLADLVGLLSLAVVANILYCVCYPLDRWMCSLVGRDQWRRHRWMAWGAGTLVAAGITFLVGLAVTAPILANDPFLPLEPPQ